MLEKTRLAVIGSWHSTRMVVRELDYLGICSYCANLDLGVGEYVVDIFGNQHPVIDNIESPPKVPG